MMSGKRFIGTVCTLAVFGLLLHGCYDMEIENPNQPDTERALNEPGDIESLVGTQYETWFTGVDKSTPVMALSVASGELTSSWGNFGMQQMGTIPREPFPNDQSFSYFSVVANPWSNLYTAISSANDGLEATDVRDLEMDTEAQTQRMRAFAKFALGLSYTSLGITYDRAFIVPFDMDLEEAADDLEMEPYDEVHAYGMQQLQEAADLADAYDFELPPRWMAGNAFDSEEFAGVIYAYMARQQASLPRNGSQRDNLDWNQIETYVDEAYNRGFDALMIDENVGGFWSRMAGIANDPLWTRASYYTIGHQDESGNFQDWINTPYSDRDEFELDTPDARVAGQDPDGDGEPGRTQEGEYFRHVGSSLFDPARGTYFLSEYLFIRNEAVYQQADVSQYEHIRTEELDLLKAEAILRTDGVTQEAVDIINDTRVGNGELEPITVLDDEEDVWQAYYYEFRIETFGSGPHTIYNMARGWDEYEETNGLGGLISGTPLHLPVPADELELLLMDSYTFGGDEGEVGEDVAPRVQNPAVQQFLDDEMFRDENISRH